MDTKICSKCRVPKPLAAFHKDPSRSDGLYPQCKDCHNQANRETRLKDPEGYRTYFRERARKRRENPEVRAKDRAYAIRWYNAQKVEGYNPNLKKYGITAEIYTAMYQQQEGKCKICGDFYEKLCVDHCHKTNRVRGLLCHPCNKGLGNFRDGPELLIKASQYL